ncbi:MAG: 3-dehydroquinate synthase [Planctomycetota bacterium]
MPTVPVELASGTYDVHIERGLLDDAGQRLAAIAPARKVVVIADENVAPLHLPTLRASLETAGYEVIVASLGGGEAGKRLETLLPVYEQILAAGIDRRTPVIGLGGGVTTDMAGFVAATLLRGVPFVPVPTSLLAMVDASVGGKTGVNSGAGKNLIGAFHQPAAVLIDTDTLATLPPKPLREGLAECIKHAVIRDAAMFAKLQSEIGRALALDLDWLTEHVAANVAIKAAVVAEDPYEHGVRAHLNLGHTFGHAIEKVTANAVSHGDAVALGVKCATVLAERVGSMNAEQGQAVRDVLANTELATTLPGLDPSALFDAMKFDKKVRDGKVRLVLPVGIGAAQVRDDIADDDIRAAWSAIG